MTWINAARLQEGGKAAHGGEDFDMGLHTRVRQVLRSMPFLDADLNLEICSILCSEARL